MTIGFLGWGNRKGGLEAYGEGGRWEGNEFGDLLGDALNREGQSEGAGLVVVSLPRFCKIEREQVAEAVRELVQSMWEETPDVAR